LFLISFASFSSMRWSLPKSAELLAGRIPRDFGAECEFRHVCFYGEFRRITGRAMDAEKTTQLTLSRPLCSRDTLWSRYSAKMLRRPSPGTFITRTCESRGRPNDGSEFRGVQELIPDHRHAGVAELVDAQVSRYYEKWNGIGCGKSEPRCERDDQVAVNRHQDACRDNDPALGSLAKAVRARLISPPSCTSTGVNST
jgi:hypothetical protein